MNRIIPDANAEALIRVLTELKRLHEELALVVQNKLDAMRRADTQAIGSAVAREEFLIGRIRDQESLRRRLLDGIARDPDRSTASAQPLTAAELAARLHEPYRSRLLGLAAGLRACVRQTEEANRVAAIISAEMIRHFRQIYQVMAAAGSSPGVYARNGRPQAGGGASVFEAVG